MLSPCGVRPPAQGLSLPNRRMKLRRRGGMIMGVTDEKWLLSGVRRLSGIAGVWPLWDPRGVMPRLKRWTLPYPEPLRQGLTRTCL
jgi:hypothetical protein